MRSAVVTLSLIVGAFLIWPAKARVNIVVAKASPLCACCAEEGEWYERSRRLSDSDLYQLDRVRFASAAHKYMSPADDEGDLASQFTLSQVRNGRRWQLRYRDEQGKTGTIAFLIPPTAVSFGVDLHDQPPGGVGPALYKEWRFSGRAQLAGIFKKGMTGAVRYHLILQGRGNNCGEAEDYKNWNLQISSARKSYTIYGALGEPQ